MSAEAATPRTCKARKGMVLVYEYVSTSARVDGPGSTSTTYRLGFVERATREGAVAAIGSGWIGRADVYDEKRKSHGYRPVTTWRLVPELPAASIPADCAGLSWPYWASWDEAKAALRELIGR
jgi:hypothetical protein